MKLDYKQALQIVKAATQGPWVVVVDNWPHHLGGEHIERRIFTKYDDPQLRGPCPIVSGSVCQKNDADYIAYFDPPMVAAYIKRCKKLEKALLYIRSYLESAIENEKKTGWKINTNALLGDVKKFSTHR